MIEYIFMITTILGAIICLMQRDLLKAAILTGIPGASLAFLVPVPSSTRCGINTSNCWFCYCAGIFRAGSLQNTQGGGLI